MSNMENEIMEQPESVKVAYENSVEMANTAKDIISNGRNIFITGSGTSYHSAMYLNYILDLLGINARSVQSSQISGILKNYEKQGGVLVAFSQSGESIDALNAIKIASENNFKVIGITNSGNSKLSREADISIVTGAGKEMAVTATKSFTAAMMASVAIYDAVTGNKTNTGILSEGIYSILKNKEIIDIAARINRKTIVLGSDGMYPIALEGALKLRETDSLYAEGFPFREYLHGYIQTLDNETSVICINDEPPGEIKKYTGNIIKIRNDVMNVKSVSGILDPVLHIVPLQLISLYYAGSHGLDPDKPEKLHKVVKQ